MMRVNGKGIAIFTIVVVILLVPFVGDALFGDDFEDALPAVTQRFFVNDFANVLTDEDEQAVYEAGVNLQTATTAQVVLVTVEDTGNRDLETFSLDLARDWGIGQEGEDNGILLLFTVDGPHSRIEVGYGLEGAMPDAKAGRILDTYLVPCYGDETAWSKGLRDTYTAILNVVYQEYGLTDQQLPLAEPLYEEDFTSSDLMALLPFLLILLFIILRSGRGGGVIFFPGVSFGGRSGGFGGGGGGGFRGGGGGFGGGGASR